MLARRRRVRFVLASALAGATVIAAASCGFQGEATREPLVDDRDVHEAGPSLPEAGPPPDGPTAVEGGPDGGPDAPTTTCPTSDAGVIMVAASLPDGGAFCIDATEVTNAQYDAFLAAIGGGADADAGFGGAAPAPSCLTYAGPFTRKGPTGTPSKPVDYVTWCDGFAYCRWAGKRLCGKIDGANASTGEWFSACSAGGTRAYPYGAAYVPSACNTESAATRQAGASPGCVGGVPGLLDMSGNAGEWVDACNGLAQCAFAGGFYGSQGESSCSALAPGNLATTQTYGGVGFRCCDDAP